MAVDAKLRRPAGLILQVGSCLQKGTDLGFDLRGEERKHFPPPGGEKAAEQNSGPGLADDGSASSGGEPSAVYQVQMNGQERLFGEEIPAFPEKAHAFLKTPHVGENAEAVDLPGPGEGENTPCVFRGRGIIIRVIINLVHCSSMR